MISALLILVSMALAAPPPKKLAGAVATAEGHARSCALDYAAFENAAAARRAAEKPVYDKLARLRRRFAEFTRIDASHNREFVGLAQACNRGEPCRAKFFFDIENAVLKELNDKVVGDKDLVTALTNLHKDVLAHLLDGNPWLKKHLVAQYSDFKSVRLAFDSSAPELQRVLAEKMRETARRYAEYTKSLVEEKGWAGKSRGLAEDARNWYHGGVGRTADEAGLAAKCSRSNLGPAGVAVLRSFGICSAQLEAAARNAGRYQGWVAKRFVSVEGFLAEAPNGKKVMSAEAIEAVKKTVPAEPGAEAFFNAIQDTIRRRFGIELSPKEARALSEYMTFADKFSPGLLQEERVVIDMGTEASGVISADFKGQNARNLEETMKALADTEGRPLAQRVRAVRAGEVEATKLLDEKKARFQRVLARIFPGKKAQFSGDDGIGFLDVPLSPDQKKLFLRYWKEDGGSPGDIRLTFEEFRYRDTGAPIPAEARSRLVVEAEGLEKKLRAALIRDLSRDELNGLQIAVSLSGREKGASLATVHLASARDVSPKVRARVQEIVGKGGFGLEAVELTRLR